MMQEELRSPRRHDEVESEDGSGKRGEDDEDEGEGESLGNSRSSHTRSSASSCARSSASSLSPHARRRTSPSSNASPASTSSSNREDEEEEEEEESSPRDGEEEEEEKSLGTLFPGLADDDEEEEDTPVATSRHLNGHAVGTQEESAAASPRSPATHAASLPASSPASVTGRRLGSGGYKMVVEQEEGEGDGMCVVEDVQLPDMYLPGRVVHLYRYAR
jgi:hypothetical protein